MACMHGIFDSAIFLGGEQVRGSILYRFIRLPTLVKILPYLSKLKDLRREDVMQWKKQRN